MKILDKYLIREFLIPFFYCLFVFIFLYIIIDLFGHLDEILRQYVSVETLFTYYISFTPVILVQTMPISALLSILYMLGNFNRHNEITAMLASGISLYRLILPFLIIGLFLSFISLAINEKIVPMANLTSMTIKEEKIENNKNKTQNKETALKDVAFYGKEDRMFYVKNFNQKENSMSDIIILEHGSGKQLKSRITAEKARFEDGRWKFYNMVVYPIDESGQLTDGPVFYKEKIFDLPEVPGDFTHSNYQIEFMTFFELKDYIKRFKSSGYKPVKELVDLHNKIAFPLINFVIILMGIPFALRSPRGGALMYIGASVGIGFLFYGLMAVNIALGKGGLLPPVLAAWITNILFSLCGLIMLIRINK